MPGYLLRHQLHEERRKRVHFFAADPEIGNIVAEVGPGSVPSVISYEADYQVTLRMVIGSHDFRHDLREADGKF